MHDVGLGEIEVALLGVRQGNLARALGVFGPALFGLAAGLLDDRLRGV